MLRGTTGSRTAQASSVARRLARRRGAAGGIGWVALMCVLALPAHAGHGTGRLRVGATIVPASGRVMFHGRVLPDGAAAALRPHCRVTTSQTQVRGEIFDLDADRPAAGVRVVVRNGGRWLAGTTDSNGHYVILAPRTGAMTVTVVQAARPGPGGWQVVNAPMGRAACLE